LTNELIVLKQVLFLKDFNMPQLNQLSEKNWAILFLTWVIVSVSTMGSLFFSHVMEFAPCVLCWYQRICLFPLVIILASGLFPFDKHVAKYALPLAIAGWLTAFYHNLLYSGIIPQDLQPCSKGVSCTEKYIDLFGFLTIPMLSLISFSIIITLLLLLKRRNS
jgi:disulfide bond formation protein DsbB